MDSSRCRGTMVIISISQRKATSVGTRPDGSGSAIFVSINRREEKTRQENGVAYMSLSLKARWADATPDRSARLELNYVG
jgi:hypothetical protein